MAAQAWIIDPELTVVVLMWLNSLPAALLWILDGCSEMFENEILKVNCAQQFSVMEAPRCRFSMMAVKNSVILELITRVRTRLYFTEFVTAARPIR